MNQHYISLADAARILGVPTAMEVYHAAARARAHLKRHRGRTFFRVSEIPVVWKQLQPDAFRARA